MVVNIDKIKDRAISKGYNDFDIEVAKIWIEESSKAIIPCGSVCDYCYWAIKDDFGNSMDCMNDCNNCLEEEDVLYSIITSLLDEKEGKYERC